MRGRPDRLKPPTPDERWCSRCRAFRPVFGSFHHAGTSWCRLCSSHSSEAKKARRKSWLKCKYGLTLEAYNQQLNDQGGGCAICGFVSPGPSDPLAVDHDHETGQRRGLLCGRCNYGLGMFQDNLNLLENAAKYLAHHGGVKAA